MSSLFTNYFGVFNALNFERYISTVGHTYITFGKCASWTDESSPPTPTDASSTFFDYWDNMIGMKQITPADINLVIPRVDWTTGTVYTEYSGSTELLKKVSDSSTKYYYNFYARNTKDQIFKCLYNNNSAPSTVMPEIRIDGQLPESAYIITSDGYKWKYMYTIPSGLKQKFFTSDFMPVVSESIVTNSAVDGRLDIIKIPVAGAGYNANSNANSLSIVTVSGDGEDAIITLKVSTTAANGANIVDYNIIDAGYGYRNATLTLNDPLKIAGTANGSLLAVIGPAGGHGSDVVKELGASNLMVSVDIEGDEGGYFPISAGEYHYTRQIGIINSPRLMANNALAIDTKYRATNKYTTSGSAPFSHGSTVFHKNQADNTITFSGIVDHVLNKTSGSLLYLSNITGKLVNSSGVSLLPLNIADSNGNGDSIMIEEVSPLKKYSGNLLYIENSTKFTRSLDETTQFKFVLSF